MDEIKSFLGAVTLANILPTVVVLLVGVLVIKAVLKLAKKSLKKSKLENAAASLILSLLKVVLYGLLGMMAASKLGIDVTGVVALASVASLALSLALQDSLSNVIGGFLLLSNHPFRSGDFVEIAVHPGAVQTLDLTYTKLSTPANQIIPTPAAPFAAVTGYGESAINYTLRVWTSAEKYWDVFFAVNENIQAEFDKAGVQMTYPHLNVHIDK